jgi:2-isopropylmalate synthase
MDATRADREFVAELAETALQAGARTLNLPDTVGFARPDAVQELFAWVRARVPALADAVLSFHGQDDLGLATANSLAAIAGGARQVEVAVNGIGERAGNTAFEEVVMALHVHGEALGLCTGIDTRAIHELSRLVAERSGIAVAPNKAVVGANAFRHASGIHQDGVLKHRATFECFDPAAIGHPEGTQIVLGKLSGRAGFAARAAQLGLRLEGRALARAFDHFQELAAAGAGFGDDEVRAACEGTARLR